ncbi:cytochrome d ubiquinol oxidase subunit II [Actinomarinicola tropica]|uniref:Cytochrome d ubiquinol oxidase subunit II n=1 Tax=Actinomarinicola tropica TaxID=2789776 RepID=A0A5Q2RH55_9ACTN|nr:cytochrome d ubiquinol oxidase subunit II [Actinomarinicola tropica]QGG93861.1 cytochrome d ubiquinol oxidase subunit II [Actinomarinicola tropica]
MTLEAAVAAVLFLGVVLYAVLGGADFGSGFWDLTAGDASRGARIRTLVDHSIGPVWEANHVWLIYVLVFLWTGFPGPFAAIMTTLFVPLAVAALGIVLRGSGFAFRKFAATLDEARLYGVLFATSSVITPFFLGAVAGAVASGRVPVEGYGDAWRSWTGPTSIVGGVLAVLSCAFLAGSFLTAEAERGGDLELAERLRSRTLVAGFVTGAVALAAVVVLRADAETLAEGLQGRGAAFVAGSAVAGITALWLLWIRRFGWARAAAVVAVAAIVVGWGVGQYPWILVEEVEIAEGAGARATLQALLWVFGAAALTVVPALGYMFWLTQQEEWAAEPGPVRTR